ncbi:hypothetical protein PVAP13_6NG034883 [Panicum virgatum]|uniref:Uncharacterized protein n=1 Tax=Panicum virgatum TaxID=38727 RepID=A0A8T0QUM2_PANVG|nr:hypothetical protein PVAP13_6NG034883 [Panicum virgatum]
MAHAQREIFPAIPPALHPLPSMADAVSGRGGAGGGRRGEGGHGGGASEAEARPATAKDRGVGGRRGGGGRGRGASEAEVEARPATTGSGGASGGGEPEAKTRWAMAGPSTRHGLFTRRPSAQGPLEIDGPTR